MRFHRPQHHPTLPGLTTSDGAPLELAPPSTPVAAAVSDRQLASSTYPGGKAGEGVYQTLINRIPPHRVYIEAFVGGGAILRHKRPAEKSVVIDADPDVCHRWKGSGFPGLIVIHGSALNYLRAHHWQGDEFIYLDPPYLMHTRKTGRALYAHEFATEAEHLELLTLAKAIPAPVMISGYHSELYARELSAWRAESYLATTRGGTQAEEWLWMNYPAPAELHDYRYLGRDYRERERIKRKVVRWQRRLRDMQPLERQALLAAITEVQP